LLPVAARSLNLTAVILFLVGSVGVFQFLAANMYWPQKITATMTGWGLTPLGFIFSFMGVLLILGCLVDGVAMVVLTVPVVFPVAYALKKVKDDCQEDLERFEKEIKVPKTPFPELRFPKVYDILKEMGKPIPEGEDLNRESEQLLANYVKEKYKTDLFFVNRFPAAIKPFYVMKVDDEPEWARSVDMIFKGMEQSSGGQREHRYEKLMHQMKEKQMNPANMRWFTDVFKYGVPPMGGFSIGIERFTQQILELENVKEATLFPRDPERLSP